MMQDSLSSLTAVQRPTGPCAAIDEQDGGAIARLEAVHTECRQRKAALVVDAKGNCTLLLAPVETDAGAQPACSRRSPSTGDAASSISRSPPCFAAVM